MKKYDYIIIGSGMGALSAANFLAKYKKSVLVLEKHYKPGGVLNSFSRQDTQFDVGIPSLHEMEKGGRLQRFYNFWGGEIETQKIEDKLTCFVDGKKYVFSSGNLKEDFLKQFPSDASDIKKFFDLNRQMKEELQQNEPSLTMSDIAAYQNIKTSFMDVFKKNQISKYGTKDAAAVLPKLFRNPVLSSIVFSKAMMNMIYGGYACLWNAADDQNYPVGGMCDLPQRAVQIFKDNGGEILFDEEVAELLVHGGRAAGVETKTKGAYYADVIISSVAPSEVCKWLPNQFLKKGLMEQKAAEKNVAQSACLMFLSVKNIDCLHGSNMVYIASQKAFETDPAEYTPQNCPLLLRVIPRKETDAYYPIVVTAPLAYGYEKNWRTGKNAERGKEYYELKNKVRQAIFERICDTLGDVFRWGIVNAEPATPITFERYTNGTRGSFLGQSQQGNHRQ